MYKVRDNAISNRTIPFADGSVITFVDHIAYVPDVKVDYFRRISDFAVQTHTDDEGEVAESVTTDEEKAPVEQTETVEEAPVAPTEEESAVAPEETVKEEESEEKDDFQKVTEE